MRGRQEAKRGRKRVARKTQKRASRSLRRRLRQESLEERLALSGTGFEGNPYAPDLDLSSIGIQSAAVDEQITLDLYASGAVVADLDADGNASGDTIRLQLDPDDNPTGATLTTDGIFRWTPSSQQMGLQEFVVLGVDEGTPPLADAEVLTIEVFAGNDAPDLAEIADGQATPGELFEATVTATDPNGDSLTFVLDRDDPGATVPETATLQQLDNGSAVIRWTPTGSDERTDFAFSVLVIDNGSPTLSDREVFTVSVSADSSSPANGVPTAFDDAYLLALPSGPGGEMPGGEIPGGEIPGGEIPGGEIPGGEMPAFGLVVDAATGVLANDSDPDGDTLTVELKTQPAHGTTTFNSDGSFTYTPEMGYQGLDSFTYIATDGVNESNVAIVAITVGDVQNTEPEATADSYSVSGGSQLVTGATTGVLNNDSDADGDSLTAIVKTQPSHGTLTLSADGSFTYVPESSYLGTDSFTYVANDGIADSSEVTVSLSVVAETSAPAAVDDVYQVIEGSSLDVTATLGVLANDTDADGDTLSSNLITGPAHGTLLLNNDGSFNYAPDSGYYGSDSFTYTADDATRTSNTATVTINVQQNHTPVATADEYHVISGAQLNVAAAEGVLANDSDEDGQALTASILSAPAYGTLTLESDGSFVYASSSDYFGADSFEYSASDGSLSSNSMKVVINVRENHAPVAGTEEYSVSEDGVLSVDADSAVMANDSDEDGDAINATLLTGPFHGTLTLEADGSFIYTPEADYFGPDLFTYQASDGLLDSGSTTVNLTVVGVNDTPEAHGDGYWVATNETLSPDAAIGVLANDFDADAGTLEATLVTGPQYGTLTLETDGSFSYTPDADYVGVDSFVYEVSDGTESVQAEATIQVGTGFGPVVISEFAASGNETYPDSQGGYYDWIEIHNTSDQSVDLEGWSLTDNEDKLDKWEFPSVTIEAGGYLVVFASSNDLTDPSSELHTNFKLSSDGEYLAILNPDGRATAEFAPEYPESRAGVAFGFDSTAAPQYFAAPTPGEPNTAEAVQFVDEVIVSAASGYYDEAFSVALSVDMAEATIRYTTDGSEPTATTEALYSEAIVIDGTTVLRAAAFQEGYLTEAPTTRSYVCVEDVLTQSNEQAVAAGFPEQWGATTADYEMDQSIIAQDGSDDYDGMYAETIADDLVSIPTLSLVLDVDDMFGTEGIYSNASGRGVEWERGVSVDYFDPNDGDTAFQIDAGIRIQGGVSRTSASKHSFRLLFKTEYGSSTLEYPLFGEDAADEFDSLTLRSSGGDRDSHFIRDTFARETQLATGNAASHGQFVQLYINGLYWGLYEIVERPDEYFAASYFGGDTEDWDVVNPGDLGGEQDTAIAGTLDAWNTLVEMAEELETATDEAAKTAIYSAILGKNPDGTDNPGMEVYLDVDNYIDYLTMEWYIENSDWPNRNYHMMRERGEDSTGFKFVAWDSEHSLGSSVGPSGTTTDFATFGANQNLGPGMIFQGLYSVEAFRARFSERANELFSEDGALYVDPGHSAWDADNPDQNVPAARYAELVSLIESPLVAESARWGDTAGGMGGGGGLPGGGQIPGGGEIPGGGGQVPGGNWSVTPDSELGDDPHANAIGSGATTLDVTAELVSVTSHIDSTGDCDVFQFTANQSATLDVRAMVSEVQIETAFNLLDASGNVLASSTADFTGMPALQAELVEGDLYYVSLAASESQETGQYSLVFSTGRGQRDDMPPGGEVPGDDIPMDGGFPGGAADGTVFTPDEVWRVTVDDLLANYFPTRSTEFLEQLRQADLYRDPTPTSTDALVITELNYNPDAPTETELLVNADFEENDFEFVELTNVSDATTDLTGLSFGSGIDFDFADSSVTTLLAGETLLLVSNQEAFETRYGTELYVVGVFGGKLSNKGETLEIVNAIDDVILDCTYDDEDGWPTEADGDGYTLELAALGDIDDPDRWGIGELGGSPGSVPDWDHLVDAALDDETT